MNANLTHTALADGSNLEAVAAAYEADAAHREWRTASGLAYARSALRADIAALAGWRETYYRR